MDYNSVQICTYL